MSETIDQTQHAIEVAQDNHDALVAMQETLSPEEVETFTQLVKENQLESANAKRQLGSLTLNQLPEKPRDDFPASSLETNKEQARESDSIFYGNAVKRS